MGLAFTLKRWLKPVIPQQLLGRYHRLRRLRYIDQLNPEWDKSRRTILAVNHHCD